MEKKTLIKKSSKNYQCNSSEKALATICITLAFFILVGFVILPLSLKWNELDKVTLCIGTLLTLLVTCILKIGKYNYMDKIENTYNKLGKAGTFKVAKIQTYNRKGEELPTGIVCGELYDAANVCLADNTELFCPDAEVGTVLNVEYYSNSDGLSYSARILGNVEPSLLMNLLIGIFIIFGLAFSIIFSI